MRYLPLTAIDRTAMLGVIGADSIDALFADVPEAARLDRPVDLPTAMGEIEVERLISRMAARNTAAGSAPFFVGAGVYRHHIPAASPSDPARRVPDLLYPYQPEVSQDIAISVEFQTQVALPPGWRSRTPRSIGAMCHAEAVMMAIASPGAGRRAVGRGFIRITGGQEPTPGSSAELAAQDPLREAARDLARARRPRHPCSSYRTPIYGNCVLFQTGRICHDAGALLVVAVPRSTSLGAIRSPAKWARTSSRRGQSFGNALNFGDPMSGCSPPRQVRPPDARASCRRPPTPAARGCLTLSTREQHYPA
jgi:glycine dehydrogenase subunit 1